MKTLLLRACGAVLYAAVGGAFLWAASAQRVGFFFLPGGCFLGLAVWEGWVLARDCRAGRNGARKWSPSMSLAYVVLAVCYVWKAVAQPSGFNGFIAVCWSVLGAAYAVKTVRAIRAADRKKEEQP